MHKNGPRTPGLITSKFDEDIDLLEANEFVKTWHPYAITYLANRSHGIKDRHTIMSAALEGSHQAYLAWIREGKPEKLVKTLVRTRAKQCYYAQLVDTGIIPDKRRVHYPKGFVPWEEFFMHQRGRKDGFMFHHDLQVLIEKKIFTETEQLFIELLCAGFDPIEISQKTGYGSRHVHKTIQALEGKLKVVKEVDFVRKYKWGRVGPYKN